MEGLSRRKLIQLLAMGGASSLLPAAPTLEAAPAAPPAEATTPSATQPNHPMKRIALEEHFVLNEPAHLERWLTLIPDAPKAAIDKLRPVITDVGERRLEAMSAAGIDLAVLSSVGVVQGMLDPTPAMQLAREANDFLAGLIRQHPTRYAGFASVPLQDPAAGADELERAMRQLGLKGVMIFGHTNGKYLDDDRFRPFWERAEALEAPVYLHAADALVMPPTYAGRPELIGATWSWTAETAAHTLRLVFGGVFERYPKVKLLLGHMGETLPYLLWRLDARAGAFGGGGGIKPAELIRRNVAITTAGMFSDPPLACALQGLGEDLVLYSVDHPFESMTAANEWFEKAPVTPEVREKIAWRNAARILKL